MEWVVQIVTAAVVAVAAWITGRWAQRSKRTEVEAAPYVALAERVDHLEKQVGILYRERHEDRNYIRLLLSERSPALPWPRPFPRWLGDTAGPIDTP